MLLPYMLNFIPIMRSLYDNFSYCELLAGRKAHSFKLCYFQTFYLMLLLMQKQGNFELTFPIFICVISFTLFSLLAHNPRMMLNRNSNRRHPYLSPLF